MLSPILVAGEWRRGRGDVYASRYPADDTVNAELAAANVADVEEAIEVAAAEEEARLAFDRSRVEMMRSYAEHHGCRRAFILGYFGEELTPPCGNCDNCDRGLGGARSEPSGLHVGTRVAHQKWGEGTVSQVDEGHITVAFDSVGYRTLDASLVASRGLLSPV